MGKKIDPCKWHYSKATYFTWFVNWFCWAVFSHISIIYITCGIDSSLPMKWKITHMMLGRSGVNFKPNTPPQRVTVPSKNSSEFLTSLYSFPIAISLTSETQLHPLVNDWLYHNYIFGVPGSILIFLHYGGHIRLIDSSIKSIQRTEFSVLTFNILAHLWIWQGGKKRLWYLTYSYLKSPALPTY